MTGRRAAAIAIIGCLAVVLISAAALRPRPRHDTPLALDATGAAGTDGPSIVRDGKGRPVLTNLRAVEPGVLYRGSAFPTSFPGDGGEREYADRTAFDHLRALNVTHVIAMLGNADAYYAEDGYLRHWSEQTGHTITTTWIDIDPDEPLALNDRGGLRAAGIVIAVMREREGDGAVYMHDTDGISHAGIAAAGYELWRNRGWHDAAAIWPKVERRFLVANETMAEAESAGRGARRSLCGDGSRAYVCAESLRRIRRELLFVIEL